MRLENFSAVVAAEDRTARELITGILRAEGLRHLRQARDGAEALSMCGLQPPDFLILDLDVPHDGLTTTRQIRASPLGQRRKLPIIVMTAYSTRANIASLRDAGATEIVCKPLTAAKVLARVASVLLKPREFIVSENFVGPDRRRASDRVYAGPLRRRTDQRVFEIDVA